MNIRICAELVSWVPGEGPCLATFFVKRYWQLLVLRIMTGISVGGTFPLVFSLVGDLFYVTQRANVAAGVQVNLYILSPLQGCKTPTKYNKRMSASRFRFQVFALYSCLNLLSVRKLQASVALGQGDCCCAAFKP